jgi:hypothetical protein
MPALVRRRCYVRSRVEKSLEGRRIAPGALAPRDSGGVAVGYTRMAPKYAVEQYGDLKRNIVGTGPFKLKEYTRGQRFVFERNPDYYERRLSEPHGPIWPQQRGARTWSRQQVLGTVS